MRRGYGLDNRDIEKLTPIMEGIINLCRALEFIG